MSALMEIQISYSAMVIFKDLTKKVQTELREMIPKVFRDDGNIYTHERAILDERDAERLTKLGISFEVHQFKGSMPVQLLPDEHGDVKTVHVHVPNVGLLMIDEVTYLEDACTNTLQMELDEGWRILCVCPPNSARRPTYILGRTKR